MHPSVCLFVCLVGCLLSGWLEDSLEQFIYLFIYFLSCTLGAGGLKLGGGATVGAATTAAATGLTGKVCLRCMELVAMHKNDWSVVGFSRRLHHLLTFHFHSPFLDFALHLLLIEVACT